jgi:5'-methylthioinosine phosphorylase
MSAAALAVIGGTGLNQLPGLVLLDRRAVTTPYGDPSAPLQFGRLHDRTVVFLARHGEGHTVPPHLVNYRANIWALREAGVGRIVAVAAVGGITPEMKPAQLVFPDQVIDYTWGRAHSFADGTQEHVQHVEFGEPYTVALRATLVAGARELNLGAVERGVYGATQGPRLESIAEIRRMARDGCDIVGMTGMPEAALARELALEYACCAVVVNWAAGFGSGDIHAEIEKCIDEGMGKVKRLLERVIPQLAQR